MATASIKGLMFQGDSPNWRPLLRLLDEELVGWFMWMFEVRTLDRRSLHAYKHSATRGYVHLDRQGRAYAYTRGDRYRPVPVAKALEEVFRDWATLGATTRERRLARVAVLRAKREVDHWAAYGHGSYADPRPTQRRVGRATQSARGSTATLAL